MKRMSLMIVKATDMDEKTVIRVVEAMETNPLQIILPTENQEEHARRIQFFHIPEAQLLKVRL